VGNRNSTFKDKIGDPKIIFKPLANNKTLPLGDVEDGGSNIFGFSAFNPRGVQKEVAFPFPMVRLMEA
jgi:hypothetical protein